MTSDPTSLNQWQDFVAELRSYREEERRRWGTLDDALIARYLASECSARERHRVEAALRQFPALRQAVDLAQSVMDAWQVAEDVAAAPETVDRPEPDATKIVDPRSFLTNLCRRLCDRVFTNDDDETAAFELFGEKLIGDLLAAPRKKPVYGAAFGLGEESGEYANVEWLAVADVVQEVAAGDWSGFLHSSPAERDQLEVRLADRLADRGFSPSRVDAVLAELRHVLRDQHGLTN